MDTTLYPQSTCALVTMAIGHLDYVDYTLPLMKKWARREGWDFHVINERKLKTNPNWPRRRFGIHVEKFQLYEILARYERVLYLDADILVNPATPDPFSLVPAGMVGGVWDDIGPEAWKREAELERLEKHLGPLPTPIRVGPRFLNAGVLVLSHHHRELWKFKRHELRRGRWPEQSLLNYRLNKDEIPVYELSESFNCMPLHQSRWNRTDERRSAYLVHYASQQAKSHLLKDFTHFQRGWRIDLHPPRNRIQNLQTTFIPRTGHSEAASVSALRVKTG